MAITIQTSEGITAPTTTTISRRCDAQTRLESVQCRVVNTAFETTEYHLPACDTETGRNFHGQSLPVSARRWEYRDTFPITLLIRNLPTKQCNSILLLLISDYTLAWTKYRFYFKELWCHTRTHTLLIWYLYTT